MPISKLKPMRDYSEHDVNNFFTLADPTGAKGTLVTILGSGFVNNASQGIAYNLFPNVPNVYSPRFEVKAKVRQSVSGEKPFGMTLYDTLEVNQFNYPLLYDPVRKAEAQAVVSGEAVPIVRKGLFLVQVVSGSGIATPQPGTAAVVYGTGQFGVGGLYVQVSSGVSGHNPAAFGEYIGAADADGYAPVYINCYR